MTIGATMAAPEAAAEDQGGRRLPALTTVRRRGPLLRPARGRAGEQGLYGIDLTAGCALDCAFCYVRGTARSPGAGRLLFDPAVAERIGPALDALGRPPSRVVLSPSSDPLPPIPEVRRAAFRVIEALIERRIEVVLMTRGRVTREFAGLLATAAGRSRVVVGFVTLGRSLGRALEPMAPAPACRLRGIERLIEAGVPVEARIEPLIPGLTDTRENLRPLLRELGRVGVREATAHHLFLQPAILPTLREAIGPLGFAERLVDAFEGGPVFAIGEVGTTKHLPIDERRAGLARLSAWAAEFDLVVRTGAAQNPDLPRLDPQAPPVATPPRASRARRAAVQKATAAPPPSPPPVPESPVSPLK